MQKTPFVLFGVPFHNVTFEEAIQWTIDRVRSGRPGVIATVNLDFLVLAQADPELRTVLREADLVIADGFPPVKLAPFFGPPLKGRVTGSDITPMLAERAEKEGISIYGLGAAEGVAAKAMEVLKKRHPNLKVAGAWSPPYAPLEQMEHAEILRRLDEAKPDILFTAFGAPKQDKFNHMHVKTWNVPVAIGIGGTLDFIAGVQTRAPVWVQKLQCEWLWRWGTNPKRLTKRYASNIAFLMRAVWLTMQLRLGRNIPAAVDSSAPPHWAEHGVEYHEFQSLEKLPEISAAKVVVDLRDAEWLESNEIGALLELSKRSEKTVLLHAGSRIRKLWEFSKLSDGLPLASNCTEALALLG
ncbi:WecB/TagA/CpsF family glycosyltransferase [Tichowtungia aerotolerans]|uniref:WecB/TagA/CpsF family glycosyltransferase n=1 Tax=Tichowtungia aerotolerans TaxID=2697043 RepID=A0A6P1M7Z4_9BACT|nr:WecB/TagA/CpsF family glycosyltransferase [Tichowtungia aerotolerans]QHI68644.1 WecB/TagA/CpsF family glycosyltransferase [Tichowtungia aerotolerans]